MSNITPIQRDKLKMCVSLRAMIAALSEEEDIVGAERQFRDHLVIFNNLRNRHDQLRTDDELKQQIEWLAKNQHHESFGGHHLNVGAELDEILVSRGHKSIFK